MKKPWAIGLLSIVPGAGFIALGNVAQGLAILAAFALLIFLCVYAPWRVVYDLSCGLAFALWVAQIYVAANMARRRARLVSGDIQEARPALPISPAPPGATRGEKLLHKARGAVAQQLLPGETVKAAITCFTMPTLGSHIVLGAAAFATMRQFHLGATERDLVTVELDTMGKPAEVRRQPLAAVKVLEAREGILNDILVLEVGEHKPLRLQVGRIFRRGTRELRDILSGKAKACETALPPQL